MSVLSCPSVFRVSSMLCRLLRSRAIALLRRSSACSMIWLISPVAL